MAEVAAKPSLKIAGWGRVLAETALVVAFAFVMRFQQLRNYSQYFTETYGKDLFIDRAGESYHRWLIDLLSLKTNGFYVDFTPQPNQAVVWLPLFNYVSTAAMLLANDFTIFPPRAVSLVFGAFTALPIYLICKRIFQSSWKAISAGLILGATPWHMDYSVLGTPHALEGFLLSLAALFLLRDSTIGFIISGILAMLTGYEAWAFLAIFILLAKYVRGWKPSHLRLAAVSFLAVVLAWCVWSALNTGNPLSWIQLYLASIGWQPQFRSQVLGLYLIETMRAVFFLFFIGLAFGLYHGRDSRILAFSTALFIALVSAAHAIGLDPGNVARLVVAYPFIAATFVPALPSFRSGSVRRLILVLLLIGILWVPILAQDQADPPVKKAFVQVPEYRVGVVLSQVYEGGKIMTDSPTVIYYSRLDPSLFVSFAQIAWYQQTRDNARLRAWVQSNDVRWAVWENATFSRASALFPTLKDAQPVKVGDLVFRPVYEDSLRKRLQLEEENRRQNKTENLPLWEHLYSTTIPQLIVYKIEITGAQARSVSASMVGAHQNVVVLTDVCRTDKG